MRRLVTSWVLMAIVVAFVVGPSAVLAGNNLGIIEDPEPIGNGVEVTVHNTSSQTRKGVVTVRAMIAGHPAKSSVTVVVSGGATPTAVVSFASTVETFIDAGIIEDPDPIPQ